MSVLVTGAAGFIGRHVVATLVGRGIQVLGVDRRTWSPVPGEVGMVADLAAPSPELHDALAQATGVIHLAGRPGVRDSAPDADRLRHRDNVVAGRNVLAAVPLHVPVVVASSSSVYGGVQTPGRACQEDDALRPAGGYARSKVALEALCHQRAAAGGLVSIARPFTVAGEGQRPDMAIARWLAAVRSGRPLPLFGGNDVRRDITDVRDVAEGLVRMLEREVRSIVNLGSGTDHSLADLVRAVAEALDADLTVEMAAPHPAEVRATLADTRRCRHVLDLTPSTDLVALVRRQAQAVLAPAA